MSKVSVIYWSGTGNTEAMANAVVEGATEAGAEVKLLMVGDATLEDVTGADAVALGCPSMGAEELEDGEMEPFVASLEGQVQGKKMVLFGSYDWGDGEWMRNWQERMVGYGAALATDEGLIVNNEPDDDGIAQCKALGAKLA